MATEEEGQPIDIGPVVDPVDQRTVPFMGQEALAARLEGLGIYVTVAILQEFFATQQIQDAQIARIDERTQRLTPQHQRDVQTYIDHMVRTTKRNPTPLTYSIIYGRLKHRFRAGSYKEIGDERFDEVMNYLHDELRKATGGQAPEQNPLF